MGHRQHGHTNPTPGADAAHGGSADADAFALVELVPEPLAILAGDGRVLDVNALLLDLTGLARDEMVGTAPPHTWWSLRGWENGDITAGETPVTVTGRRGHPIPMRCRLHALSPSATGAPRWAATLGDPRDPHGPATLRAEHEALLLVAREVARGVAPTEVFHLVAHQAARVLNAEAGIVWRFGDHGSTVVGAHGDHGSQVGVTFPLQGNGAVVRVARTGRPARAAYGRLGDADPTAARVVHQGYVSGVAAPVTVEGRAWGAVLAATTTERPFPVDAEERLGRFAEMVSLAIAGAHAREELARRAALDDLTGIPNQGEFHRRLAVELARARRHGRPLSLVVFDLDHFKRVNDEAGHQVGDRVLQAVAGTITGGLRAEDVFARAGGEEFALILPESDAATAIVAAERARVAVASLREAGLPPVTVSAGVADITDADDPDALFAAADHALYFAKRSGRNQVRRFGPEALAAQADEPAPVRRSGGWGGVRALALAVEAKDPATNRHSERVADLACRMAAAVGWSAGRLDDLRQATLVHDVGKIGVSDRLLLKAGRLTPDEYERVKIHPVLGAGIVAEVLGADQTSWVRHHHERFDGTGYPDGLSGTGIPEGARLIAVADAFDVMTTGRNYARARQPLDAAAEIRSLAGMQFCPEAVEALVRVLGLAEAG